MKPGLTEREKSRILKAKNLDYKPNPAGLGHELFYSMRQNKSAIAQIDAQTGEKDSYENLLQRCIRTSLKLLISGITGNDIICHCSSNHLNSCVPIISSLFLGIRVTPLDPSLPMEDTVYILDLVKPKVIFVSPDTADFIEEALEQLDLVVDLVVFGESDKYIEFSEYLESVDDEEINEVTFRPLPILNITDTAVILFSSAQPGCRPKGVCLSHYSLLVQTVNMILDCNLGRYIYLYNYKKDECENGLMTILDFRTYFWITAILTLGASLLTAATRVIIQNFEATAVWHLIEKYKIDFLTCRSSEAIQLATVGKPERVEGKSLKLLVAHSRRIADNMLLELRKLLPQCFITNKYVQPEGCGPITTYSITKPRDIKDQYENPTSCGKLVPGISCKIVNPYTHKIQGPNQPGEIMYKVEFFTVHYFNMDSTLDFDDDGFFKSGDLAYFDEEHRFYVLDRLTELFKYRKWDIVPMVVEDVIKEHPAVNEAVVIGIPQKDSNIGESLMGVVTLKKNMWNKVTADIILNFVNNHVSDRQQLRAGLKIVKEIPLTISRKPKRKKLKESILTA